MRTHRASEWGGRAWGRTGGLLILGCCLAGGSLLASDVAPSSDPLRRHVENRARLEPALPKLGRPPEYGTSGSCRDCHPDEHASWHRSFHRTMTQMAVPEAVVGRFDGTTVDSGGLKYRVGRDGDAFWAEGPDPDLMMYVIQGKRTPPAGGIPSVRLPVVMTTGSHHYQTYWVASPRHRGLLQTLPLVYLIDDGRWIPREEAFLRGSHDTERFVTQWNHHCIRCHSTGGNPGLDETTGELKSEVAELGISCEACHGPAAEHVRVRTAEGTRPGGKPSGERDPTVVNPARLDHRRSSEVCGLCHGVHVLREEFAMEFARNGPLFRPGEDLSEKRYLIQHPRVDPTPARREEHRKNPEFFRERWWDDGTILSGGREFAALSASACYVRGTASCLSCHAMHGSDPNDQLRRGKDGSGACTACHRGPTYTTEVERHTHHRVDSAGSDCLNCHMPHTTYALLKGIRSHQIESPQVRSSVRHGVPNACNLCHLDRTLEWAGTNLTRWYGQAPERFTEEQRTHAASLVWMLRGHAAQRVIAAWHMGWEPARQASGGDWQVPFLAELLADPQGVIRYVAERSLRSYPGFDGPKREAPGPGRAEEIAAIRDRWRALHPAPSRRGGEVLIGPDGAVMRERVAVLLETQDPRPVTISE